MVEEKDIFINPLTGEMIEKTISRLSVLDKELKDLESKVAEARQAVKSELFDMLLSEDHEIYEMDTMIAKIIRPTRREFRLENVLDMLGDTRTYTNKKGQLVDLYKPVASAVKDYVSLKIESGTITNEEVEKYRSSFEEVGGTPYVLVSDK